MSVKLLVIIRAPEQAQTGRDTACELSAVYPDSLLVRCTETQQENNTAGRD